MRVLIPLFAASIILSGFNPAAAQEAVKDSCVIYNATNLQGLNQSPSDIKDSLESAKDAHESLKLDSLAQNGTAYRLRISDSRFAALQSSEQVLVSASEAQAACDRFKDQLPAGMEISADLYFQIDSVPNDPKASEQWGLSAIDAYSAWDTSQGAAEVIVAVLDTGVDYTHEDLAANMWKNPGEIAGNGIDDDGNGYVDDVRGWDFFNNDNDSMDDHSHGTHCAGVIAGAVNNSVGIAGVAGAGAVKILGLKFLSASGGGSLSGAVAAFNYLVDLKNRTGSNIRITSNSWGGGGSSEALRKAIEAATQAGMLVIAAAGNASNNNDQSPTYPANYGSTLPEVVSVASTNSDGSLSSFSNYGVQTVDVAAPGGQILSTVPNNGYRSLSGTSMATPHVAGALALLLSAEAGLSNSELLYRL
ncbi:MAG: S8 family serine peptidase, partial [Bdellovibrionales bacterium]|nr:S8 family serine peptidase [Bdellovibrionales bacterium]